MTFNSFINQQVKNINDEVGVVTSIDPEHIVVKYSQVEKTYNTEIVFKNEFLSFLNDELNQLIDDYVNHRVQQEEEKQQLFNDNKEAAIVRQHKVNELYNKISMKYSFMKCLFGSDFIYPPYEEFIRKYKHLIHKRTFNFKLYSYRYWEYL